MHRRSFRKAFLGEVLRTRVDVVVRSAARSLLPSGPDVRVGVPQGSVSLPSTRFNSATRKLGLQGPIAVDLRDVTITAIL